MQYGFRYPIPQSGGPSLEIARSSNNTEVKAEYDLIFEIIA